jgi:hypothetical protein
MNLEQKIVKRIKDFTTSLKLRAAAAICQHRWVAPDLAFFEGQENNVFEVRCADCGKVEAWTGREIQSERKHS